MSNVLDSKRLPAAALALAFALTATSSLFAVADAPPGAYLQSTTKSQSLPALLRRMTPLIRLPVLRRQVVAPDMVNRSRIV